MKVLFLFLILFPIASFANDDDCNYPPAPAILDQENMQLVGAMNNIAKREFKRRPVGSMRLALNIETNFEAPLIGKDIYWGRIYLKDGEANKVFYRDDIMAEDNFKKEEKNPSSVSISSYPVKDINSASGLSLIKAAGAEVNVKAVGKFSTSTGGRLSIKVKPPGEKFMMLTIDVVNSKGKISNFLIVNNKRIPFDSFKINASKNFLGVTTILSGIKNIQFTSGGKVIHTINP